MTTEEAVVGDQAEINELALRFADAVNRIDTDAFRDVWTPQATWIIDPPTDFRVSGPREEIATTFGEAMRATYEFFVQIPQSLLVEVSGDSATARSYLAEHGRTRAGGGYFNYGYYLDELERTSEGWRFSSRHYGYLYVDDTVPSGKAFPRPPSGRDT
jgi:ketosteroid isomerase-like protein